MKVQTEPRLIDASQAARLLGCSRRTIRRLAEAGKLTPVRFTERGHLRFRPEDLDALIQTGGSRP